MVPTVWLPISHQRAGRAANAGGTFFKKARTAPFFPHLADPILNIFLTFRILQVTAFSFTGLIESKSYAPQFNFKTLFPRLRAIDVLIDCFCFITLL